MTNGTLGRKAFPRLFLKKKWRTNLILFQLIFTIERNQPFRTERILCLLINNERKKLIEEEKEKKEKCVSSSSSLLDLIIFLTLLSECEWWADMDQKHKN